MDPAALRSQFPVFERLAFLNAGSCGPLPAEAVIAARERLAAALHSGRAREHFEARFALGTALRAGYARVLGAQPADVALTTSTSEGIAKVIAGLDVGPGDEIVTADDEHPGLVGPLMVAAQRGAVVREVKLAEVADAVGPKTTLVACSHVSWATGEVAPAALRELDVPVVLDGAQGAGAVPADVGALGCDAYAGSGQKWLCGADGTGMLFVSERLRERLRPVAPAYMAFADTVGRVFHDDARRHDAAAISLEALALSLASLQVLERFGFGRAHARAAALAERLAGALAARGLTVAPRGNSTLVSWEDPDPAAAAVRAAEAGVVIRSLPGTPYARASVGAWNDEHDLERLLAVVA